MSTFRFKLNGEHNNIDFDAFILALNCWYKILKEVDVAISGEKTGSLEWVLINLENGSAIVEAKAFNRLENTDLSFEITRESIKGMKQLEEGFSPPYLSETGLRNARSLVKLVGNHGISSIEISNHDTHADLTAKASANIDLLKRVKRSAIGSIEGRLEAISLHKKSKFVVYHHITHKAVSCLFDRNEQFEMVRMALGNRVIVFGDVQYNYKNEPIKVSLEKLRILRPERDLPAITQISGSIPDFTGEVSTIEYLRSLRGG